MAQEPNGTPGHSHSKWLRAYRRVGGSEKASLRPSKMVGEKTVTNTNLLSLNSSQRAKEETITNTNQLKIFNSEFVL